jgi:hypothetical protein
MPKRYWVAIGMVVHLRRATITVIVILAAFVAWFLAVAPPLLGFALAVALAVAWCIWLERHPERADASDGQGGSGNGRR